MDHIAEMLRLIANYVADHITKEELVMAIRRLCDRLEKE